MIGTDPLLNNASMVNYELSSHIKRGFISDELLWCHVISISFASVIVLCGSVGWYVALLSCRAMHSLGCALWYLMHSS
jgi:hypothetical protein